MAQLGLGGKEPGRTLLGTKAAQTLGEHLPQGHGLEGQGGLRLKNGSS